MTRRGWLASLIVSITQAALLFASRSTSAQQQVADLSQTLRSVLKCRRQVEFDFVEVVVAKVNQGLLPAEMVLSMMKWARERRDDIPFPYFQEGIRRRAKEVGVTL